MSINFLNEEMIIDSANKLAELQDEYVGAKLGEIDAREEWDKYLCVALANGEITGRNESERSGSAMQQNPDLYRRMIEASRLATHIELEIKVAKTRYDMVGRLIALANILRNVDDDGDR